MTGHYKCCSSLARSFARLFCLLVAFRVKDQKEDILELVESGWWFGVFVCRVPDCYLSGGVVLSSPPPFRGRSSPFQSSLGGIPPPRPFGGFVRPAHPLGQCCELPETKNIWWGKPVQLGRTADEAKVGRRTRLPPWPGLVSFHATPNTSTQSRQAVLLHPP